MYQDHCCSVKTDMRGKVQTQSERVSHATNAHELPHMNRTLQTTCGWTETPMIYRKMQNAEVRHLYEGKHFTRTLPGGDDYFYPSTIRYPTFRNNEHRQCSLQSLVLAVDVTTAPFLFLLFPFRFPLLPGSSVCLRDGVRLYGCT